MTVTGKKSDSLRPILYALLALLAVAGAVIGAWLWSLHHTEQEAATRTNVSKAIVPVGYSWSFRQTAEVVVLSQPNSGPMLQLENCATGKILTIPATSAADITAGSAYEMTYNDPSGAPAPIEFSLPLPQRNPYACPAGS